MAAQDDSKAVDKIVAVTIGRMKPGTKAKQKSDETEGEQPAEKKDDKPGKLGLALADALGIETEGLDGEAIESLVADICERHGSDY